MTWSPARKYDAALKAPRAIRLIRPDTRVIERPGWLQLITPSAKTHLNEVTFAQLEEADCERAIDETIAMYRAHGVGVRWHVGPDSRPADLGARLERRGFSKIEQRAMVIAADAQIAAPTEISVLEIDERTLDAHLAVQGRGWNTPRDEAAIERASYLEALSARERIVHLFGASIDGEMIGTAGFATVAGGVGYLIGGQVLEHARGRGAYRALTQARLAAMRAAGCELAVTYARASTAAPPLLRMGFEPVFDTTCWVLAAVPPARQAIT